MKKNLYLLLLVLGTPTLCIAQNTFPTSGNVGVGTTSPQNNIGFTNVDADNGTSGITWYNPSPLNFGIYKTAGTWSSPNYQQLSVQWATGIVLNPGNNYGKSYVDIQGNGLRVSSGNLGIGTSNPVAALDVGGFIQISSHNQSSPPSDLGYGLFPYGGIGLGIFSGATDPGQGIGIWTNPNNVKTEVMRISTGGNVGIGTTNPGSLLSLGNSISNRKLALFENGNVAYGFGIQAGTFQQFISNDTPTNHFSWGVLTSNGSNTFSETMRLTELGNLLIGQTSQVNSAYKLDVAGSVRANQVIVNTTGADFVFNKNYRLNSLANVEKYITKNHHLPDIASANKMRTDGMDVGGMNKKLLQKIEELTLYLIHEQNEISALKKDLRQIKNKKI